MRAVILFNPKVPVEHWQKGREYSDMSLGFDFRGKTDDNEAIARHLHELAEALTSKHRPYSESLDSLGKPRRHAPESLGPWATLWSNKRLLTVGTATVGGLLPFWVYGAGLGWAWGLLMWIFSLLMAGVLVGILDTWVSKGWRQASGEFKPRRPR